LQIVGKTQVSVEPGQVGNVPLTLHADRGAIHGRRRVGLVVNNHDDSIHVQQKSEFFAPEEK